MTSLELGISGNLYGHLLGVGLGPLSKALALKKEKILYLEMSQYEVRFDLLSQYSFDFYGELDFLTELEIVFYFVALLK